MLESTKYMLVGFGWITGVIVSMLGFAIGSIGCMVLESFDTFFFVIIVLSYMILLCSTAVSIRW